VASPGAPNSPVSVPVTFTVGPVFPGGRVIYAAVNSASFSAGPLAPGSLFSIFGANIANAAVSATAFPLPTQLGGISLTVNNIAAPLLYVGPMQINAQAPYELQAGPAQIVVLSNGIALAALTVQVVATAPGIFTFLDGSGRAAAENQNYTVNTPQNPAKAGSYLIVYLTGQGAVSPAVRDGAPASSTTLSNVLIAATATIGGQQAQVSFAGLAPTLAGVTQMNILIPNLAPGTYPLVVSMNGKASNSATITIGP
jgi:uncharacterized protein (TIGR03437 family)